MDQTLVAEIARPTMPDRAYAGGHNLYLICATFKRGTIADAEKETEETEPAKCGRYSRSKAASST